MKKCIALAVVAVAMITRSFAFGGETVSAKFTTRFNQDFKGASGVWDIRGIYNEVLFFWHDQLTEAIYDEDGNLVGTFRYVKPAELPAVVQGAIQYRYKGAVMMESAVLDKPGEDSLYYASVQNGVKLVFLEISKDGHTVNVLRTLR
jgi:hypothetical protein